MTSMKWMFVAAGLISSAAALVSMEASARAQSPANSSVTMRYDVGDAELEGGVASSVRRCAVGREVDIYKRRDGRDRLIGTDWTNTQQAWSLRRRRAHGAFYAVVSATEVQTADGATVDCGEDRSPTVRP